MAGLRCLAFHMLLLFATSLSDTNGHCAATATCSADGVEWQQEAPHGRSPRSRSFVQMQAVKMRYPAEDLLQLGVADSPVSAAPAAVLKGSVDTVVDTTATASSANVKEPEVGFLMDLSRLDKKQVPTEDKDTIAKLASASVSERQTELGTTPLSEASAPVSEAAVVAEITTTIVPMAEMVAEGQELSSQMVPIPSPHLEERYKEESQESSKEDTNPQQRHGFMHDLSGGLFDIDKASTFLRGKPQVLSIFIMMLLPAGMCTVMYCVFHIIRMMEDEQSSAGDQDSNAAASSRRATLGEVMQPQDTSHRSYEPLCPELLAPSGNECVIALPSIHDVSSGTTLVERMIVSKTGSPIVRLTLTRMSDSVADDAGGGTSYGAAGQIVERLSIIGFKRQNALGFCELQIPPAHSIGIGPAKQQMKCNIYRPTGDLFATLEEEPTGVVGSLLATHGSAGVATYGTKCYMLTTVATGTRFWIQGDMTKRNLVVLSESDKKKPLIYVDSGEQLQFKSEESDYYRIRVQPKVDAGVVIMALLAMDRLSGSQRSGVR